MLLPLNQSHQETRYYEAPTIFPFMRALHVRNIYILISIASISCLSLHHRINRSSMSAELNAATTSRVAKLAQELIRIESITPKDGGCQEIVRRRLEKVGFTCETLQYHDVTNLWAHRGEVNKPMIVFAGHSDVVPPGPLEDWSHPPFEGFIDQQNVLHGRGAVDMKGGMASFIVALEDFLQKHPDCLASSPGLGVIITSDEEGKAGKHYVRCTMTQHLAVLTFAID